MVDCWQTLGVDSTSDLKSIKSAYAKALKRNNPEDSPDGYQLIKEAYKQALAYLQQQSVAAAPFSSENPEQSVANTSRAVVYTPPWKEDISEIKALLEEREETMALDALKRLEIKLLGAPLDTICDVEEALLLALTELRTISYAFLRVITRKFDWSWSKQSFPAGSRLAYALHHVLAIYDREIQEQFKPVFEELHQQGEESALKVMDELINSTLFESIHVQELFQQYFLLNFFNSENWPFGLLHHLVEKFEWKYDQNPYSPSSEYFEVYHQIFGSYLRYRNQMKLVSAYKEKHGSVPSEVINELFSGFDPARLNHLVTCPESKAIMAEFMVLANEIGFTDESHPVDSRTRNYLEECHYYGPDTRQGQAKVERGIGMVILISLIALGTLIHVFQPDRSESFRSVQHDPKMIEEFLNRTESEAFMESMDQALDSIRRKSKIDGEGALPVDIYEPPNSTRLIPLMEVEPFDLDEFISKGLEGDGG